MAPLVCPHCHTACAPPSGYAGQALVCPTCSQWITSGAPLAMPIGAGYVVHEAPLAAPGAPPGYLATSDVADVEVLDEAPPAAALPQRRRPWLLLILLLLATLTVMLFATAAAYVAIARARGQTLVNPLNDRPLWTPPEETPVETRWHAADGSLTVGPANVQILRVEIGEARGKDAAGNVIVSDGDFLQVLLRIENRTPLPLDYRSWYGNDFADPIDAKAPSLRVRLHDNADRSYRWVMFDDVARVRWHTPTAKIPPRKSVEDVIVFELPPGATKANLQQLRLELPAAAVGFHGGFYRFEIPRSKIEGLNT